MYQISPINCMYISLMTIFLFIFLLNKLNKIEKTKMIFLNKKMKMYDK